MCLQYIFITLTSFIILPLPLFLPLLRTISPGFILFSYMNPIYIYHICPHSPLCPPFSHRYPSPDKTYVTLLPFIFLSVYWWSNGFLPWYFNQINPLSLFTLSLWPCSPNIQQCIGQYYILLQYFSLSKIFFPSTAFLSPFRQTH
jgi:hypothetical protein